MFLSILPQLTGGRLQDIQWELNLFLHYRGLRKLQGGLMNPSRKLWTRTMIRSMPNKRPVIGKWKKGREPRAPIPKRYHIAKKKPYTFRFFHLFLVEPRRRQLFFRVVVPRLCLSLVGSGVPSRRRRSEEPNYCLYHQKKDIHSSSVSLSGQFLWEA